MKKLKTQKGITLIALIITIIIMLILVSVTVSSTINGGLFTKAREANFKMELGKYKENFEINKIVKNIKNNKTVRINDIFDLHEMLQKQTESLEIGSQNCEDGISMILTAEGSLNNQVSILQSIHELLANLPNLNEGDRENAKTEISDLITELNRISNTCEYEHIGLLNGSIDSANPYVIEFGNGYFDQGEKLSISIGNCDFESLYGAKQIDYNDVLNAIEKARSAMDKVTEIRAYLSALLNRLEYTSSYLNDCANNINNLDVGIFTESGNVSEEQAIKNAESWETAGNLMKIMEGALSKIHSSIQMIQELVVTATYETYTDDDRKDMQKSIDEYLKVIDQILTYAGAENIKFFDGTYPCMPKTNLKTLGIESLNVMTAKDATKSETKVDNAIEKIANLRQVLEEKTNEAMSKPTEKADKGYAFDIEKMLLSNYIGEISKGMKGKLEIINGELVFVGNDEKEKQWAEEMGIKIGT